MAFDPNVNLDPMISGMTPAIGQEMPMGVPSNEFQLPADTTPSPIDGNNIAPILSEDKLKELGSIVVDEYEADLSSRSEWISRAANYFKLFAGFRDPKNVPWTKCSNVHIPLTGISAIQFQARAFDALIPSKEIARCFSTDGQTVDIAERATKYLNYQLTQQMDEWQEDMDIMLVALPIFGVAVKKTYYDHILKRPVSRFLGIDEFVANYKCKRLEDAVRKTHMFYLYLNDIKIKAQAGIYVADAGDLGTGSQSNITQPAPDYASRTDNITGTQDSGKIREYPRLILEQHRYYDLDGDGIQEHCIVTVDYETRKVLNIQSAVYTDPVTHIEKPLDFFTTYPFIPNPESWMGFGFGHFLEGLNEAANTIVNQLIDAGHLSNIGGKSGLINKRSGLKKQVNEIQLGQFKEVDIAGDDINKALYTYKFNEPSSALFNLLGLIKSYSQEITTVSESMMGKLPPSDTTATTMLAVMEQGMKVFSAIHKRLHKALGKELKKIFLINSIYLDENVYALVQDSTSRAMLTYRSGKSDFANNIDVIPNSDPNITSRAEKLIKAREVYQLVMSNPLMSQNPEAIYEITRDMLEANEVQNIDKILKRPQPPQEPPDFSPQEENSHFLAEKDVHPLPQQDHFAHLEAHNIFKDSVWGGQLTAQGKKLLEAHIRETLSFAYAASQPPAPTMMAGQPMMGQGNMGGGMPVA